MIASNPPVGALRSQFSIPLNSTRAKNHDMLCSPSLQCPRCLLRGKLKCKIDRKIKIAGFVPMMGQSTKIPMIVDFEIEESFRKYSMLPPLPIVTLLHTNSSLAFYDARKQSISNAEYEQDLDSSFENEEQKTSPYFQRRKAIETSSPLSSSPLQNSNKFEWLQPEEIDTIQWDEIELSENNMIDIGSNAGGYSLKPLVLEQSITSSQSSPVLNPQKKKIAKRKSKTSPKNVRKKLNFYAPAEKIDYYFSTI